MKGATLTLTLRPSRWLVWAIVVIHLLSFGALLLAELAWFYRVPMAIAVAISQMWNLRKGGETVLRCLPDGNLAVLAGDDWQTVSLMPDTRVLLWLVVLRYREEEGSKVKSQVVLPDSLDQDDFRRLRVWLRWRAQAAGPQALLS